MLCDKTGISIVVATKGRVQLLGELLQSIWVARQKYKGESETIIVDDSNERDSQEIKAICNKYDAKMTFFTPSVAGKRNYGANIAKYDIILFLDSDCIVTENILEEHAKLYIHKNVGAVVGLLEFIGEENWFWKAVVKSSFVKIFGMPALHNNLPWGPTANFSIRKDLFFRLNGFDEDFPNKPGGEDVDLGLRLTKLGYTIKCTSKGLVYHNKKTWIPVKDMFLRCWHYGVAEYFLLKKHPDFTEFILFRKIVLYIFMILLFVPLFCFNLKHLLLIPLIPFLIPLDICVNSFLTNLFIKSRRTSFFKQVVIQCLMLTYDLGIFTKCIRKCKVTYLFKKMVYLDENGRDIYSDELRGTWINIVSLIITLLILVLVYKFIKI